MHAYASWTPVFLQGNTFFGNNKCLFQAYGGGRWINDQLKHVDDMYAECADVNVVGQNP